MVHLTHLRCCSTSCLLSTTIVTDFDKVILNAIRSVLGAQSQRCFYHLTQSTWCKLQQRGLVTLYLDKDNVKLFFGMLDGRAFLPLDKVEGLEYLEENTPESMHPLVEYFSGTYVSGTSRHVQGPSGPDGQVPPHVFATPVRCFLQTPGTATRRRYRRGGGRTTSASHGTMRFISDRTQASNDLEVD